MTKLKSSRSARGSGDQAALGRLFVLEVSGSRVFSVNPDGSDRKVIVNECRMPDGIAVDVAHGHIYWTNMGVPNLNDGSIERADLDGRNRQTIVPQGGTFTPKQLQLDEQNGKLYWSDREGMRVMRCKPRRVGDRNPRGDRPERRRPPRSDEVVRRDQPIDAGRGHIYWTQKGPDDAGLGRICRANIEIPEGENAAQSHGYRGVVRRPARAHRSGTRSQEPAPVLDRPRRSAARQLR